jgi:hypothetical protein
MSLPIADCPLPITFGPERKAIGNRQLAMGTGPIFKEFLF